MCVLLLGTSVRNTMQSMVDIFSTVTLYSNARQLALATARNEDNWWYKVKGSEKLSA